MKCDIESPPRYEMKCDIKSALGCEIKLVVERLNINLLMFQHQVRATIIVPRGDACRLDVR